MSLKEEIKKRDFERKTIVVERFREFDIKMR